MYTFNQAGVDTKLSELYKLPEADLKTQADYIRNNFRTWVLATFTLTADQRSYVNDIPDAWIQETGNIAAKAIRWRLPIIFPGPPPSPPGPPSVKYVRSKDNTAVVYQVATGVKVTGNVSLDIYY